MQYQGDPVSWFQKKIRGSSITLSDHISKEMNELNLIRCQRIPKRPGADWRDLQDEKVLWQSSSAFDEIISALCFLGFSRSIRCVCCRLNYLMVN